jgi:hypothetical protein
LTAVIGSRSIVLEVLSDALGRIIRAAEYVADGESDEAMQVLLDLERDIRATLLGGDGS